MTGQRGATGSQGAGPLYERFMVRLCWTGVQATGCETTKVSSARLSGGNNSSGAGFWFCHVWIPCVSFLRNGTVGGHVPSKRSLLMGRYVVTHDKDEKLLDETVNSQVFQCEIRSEEKERQENPCELAVRCLADCPALNGSAAQIP